MTEDLYYPLIEIILFTIMRARVQKCDEGELMHFYKKIPNHKQ